MVRLGKCFLCVGLLIASLWGARSVAPPGEQSAHGEARAVHLELSGLVLQEGNNGKKGKNRHHVKPLWSQYPLVPSRGSAPPTPAPSPTPTRSPRPEPSGEVSSPGGQAVGRADGGFPSPSTVLLGAALLVLIVVVALGFVVPLPLRSGKALRLGFPSPKRAASGPSTSRRSTGRGFRWPLVGVVSLHVVAATLLGLLLIGELIWVIARLTEG